MSSEEDDQREQAEKAAKAREAEHIATVGTATEKDMSVRIAYVVRATRPRTTKGRQVVQKQFADETVAKNAFRALVRAEMEARPDNHVHVDAQNAGTDAWVWITAEIVLEMGAITLLNYDDVLPEGVAKKF